MLRKKIHRVCVYILDSERKSILLWRAPDGPFANQFMPIYAEINDMETPVETIRNQVSQLITLDFQFIGHVPSMPIVLDECSIKLASPLHLQMTVVDDTDFVDYVYLAQSKVDPDLSLENRLGWFSQTDLKESPNHVKHVVHQIIALMNG